MLGVRNLFLHAFIPSKCAQQNKGLTHTRASEKTEKNKKAWDAENQETQLSGRTERIPGFLCKGWSQVPRAMSPKGRPEEKVRARIAVRQPQKSLGLHLC